MNTVNNKRLVIYHPRKEYREALESASWELNAAEMSNFHEAFEILDTKEKYMQLLDDETIEETYTGIHTKGYNGKYKSDGITCNC